MLGVSSLAAISYFIALGYVVITGGTNIANGESSLISFLEGVLDLLSAIS